MKGLVAVEGGLGRSTDALRHTEGAGALETGTGA